MFFSNLDCQNQTIGVQTCFKPQKASLLLYNIASFSEILAAGTSHGRIALWRMVVQPGSNRGDTKAQWKLQTPTEIQGNVVQLQVLTGPAVGHTICLDKWYNTNLTTSICMWSSLWPSITVGLYPESAGGQQLKHSADPVWACDVSPLQSAGGSSAAHSDPAQHHSVQHRSSPCSAVWHAHQGSLCYQGNGGADFSLHLTEDAELLYSGMAIISKKAKIDVMVTGCVLSNLQDSVTVWSGKQITVYELSGTVLRNTGTTLTLSKWTKLHLLDEIFYKLHWLFRPLSQYSFVKFLYFCPLNFPGSFPCDSHIVAVHGENLYTVEPNRVQIRTPQVCCPPIEPTKQDSLKLRDVSKVSFSFFLNLVHCCVIFFPLPCSGYREAAADLLQGRGQPCTTQCVSVLPGGRHWHSAHQSLWPLPKVY